MRIAVTYENGEIFQHFGHTAQFKFYDIEEGKIVKEQQRQEKHPYSCQSITFSYTRFHPERSGMAARTAVLVFRTVMFSTRMLMIVMITMHIRIKYQKRLISAWNALAWARGRGFERAAECEEI